MVLIHPYELGSLHPSYDGGFGVPTPNHFGVSFSFGSVCTNRGGSPEIRLLPAQAHVFKGSSHWRETTLLYEPVGAMKIAWPQLDGPPTQAGRFQSETPKTMRGSLDASVVRGSVFPSSAWSVSGDPLAAHGDPLLGICSFGVSGRTQGDGCVTARWV